VTTMTSELLSRLVERVEHRYYGKYQAVVVDNADPELRARLRVRVPAVLGPEVVTGWALPCVPYGGAPDQGFFFIPEVGAGVWVEFEGGDVSYPIWVGAFWSKPGGEPETPKPNDPEGAELDRQSPPTRKIIKTLKGHTIQLEDADGDEMVIIYEATNKHVLVMNKDGVTLKDGANGHQIVLDSSGVTVTDGANATNKITMASDGVTVEDKNGNQIVMESSGVVIKSSGVLVGSDSAAEPFVLGQTFMSNVSTFITALSTHTHLGNLGAPTSPPMSPLNLVVPLSTKHKTE
jgi:uncharacterized protein involved in type VI secretion and phage assembly